jgi:hypothetical protein
MQSGAFRQSRYWLVIFTVALAGCGSDSGTSLEDGHGYSQPQIYPIGVGYSWTYVGFDAAGIPQDTSTVVIQDDDVDGDTHHLTKCWLDGEGLCPMEEIVTRTELQREIISEWCTFLRFPLTDGQSWDTCNGLIISVAAMEDLSLRTGLSFADGLAVGTYGLTPNFDEDGNALPFDTLLIETGFYAPGWGLVATESINPFTGQVSGRAEILDCSFR